MKRIGTYFAVVAITALGACAHGYVTGRWQPQGPAADVVLPEVPMALGDWAGEDLRSGVDEAALKNLTRKYTHARSGRILTISYTAGPAGLTSQHTPEYCYPGSGFQAVGSAQPFALSGRNDAFRTAVFRKGPDALRIVWGWTNDGTWSAPRVPELEVKFLRGNLAKLYVVSWDADRAPEQDADLQDFLARLLPTLSPAEAPAR